MGFRDSSCAFKSFFWGTLGLGSRFVTAWELLRRFRCSYKLLGSFSGVEWALQVLSFFCGALVLCSRARAVKCLGVREFLFLGFAGLCTGLRVSRVFRRAYAGGPSTLDPKP